MHYEPCSVFSTEKVCTMLMWVLVTYCLMLCEATAKIIKTNARQKRTITGDYPLCPRGCTSCSKSNGCITCKPKYYLLLVRRGIRHTGRCIYTCPLGTYGVRRQDYSKCYKCRIDQCEACFSRNYCTRCKYPYIAYRGRCIERCPDGLFYANYSKDCRDRVDCMVGPWSTWRSCTRNGQTCGYKYGVTIRTREILEQNSPNGVTCPPLSENLCCRMEMRHCADLISNNSDPTKDNKLPSRNRHSSKKKNRRKSRRRRHRKRKRGNKRNKKNKETWRRFCGRDVAYTDKNDFMFMR